MNHRGDPLTLLSGATDPDADGLLRVGGGASGGDAPNAESTWQRQIGDLVLSRQVSPAHPGSTVLQVSPAADRPLSERSLGRMRHEYSLRSHVDASFAAVPRALLGAGVRTSLLIEDPGGELLGRLLTAPWDIDAFLRLAIGLAFALARLHAHGLIHKDVKPDHVFFDAGSRRVWLTGLGIASRRPQEQQAREPVESLVGTLPYMAPEQTGRMMNRSVDARSDLYSMGVTLYQVLTGRLPFNATEPLEWVHCHIARRPAPFQREDAEALGSLPAIVLKLLEKTAETRYQSAEGVEADLRRCLAERESKGAISFFALGEADRPDRLLVPERLYGRQVEVDSLLASFAAARETGSTQLVFVSGYSGSGKSSLVGELPKLMANQAGLFASGKFDQYKRDIPYATFAQAFQTLIREILSKSDDDVSVWRTALQAALGANGQLIVHLIPELEILLGHQPEVPVWPAAEAAARFLTTFRAFLGVFARPDHPLVLFLDDLQWLDAASLTLLQHLATNPEVRHLLLVGAYRDNEVSATHPLNGTIALIRDAGAPVREIVLAPLLPIDVTHLVADALQAGEADVDALAQLMHEKGEGNPFFVIQFFTGLAEEGLLVFDPASQHWAWNLHDIRNKRFTSNVVELMLGRLGRLPQRTQDALRLFSCIGSRARVQALVALASEDEASVHEALQEAVQTGLVVQAGDDYEFAHDRVREAAYALLPESMRSAEHLRIGRALLARAGTAAVDDEIFEIVNQLNLALPLIREPAERQRVAELNLMAGRRARASTAYASACAFFRAGAILLSDDGWDFCRDLAFEVERDLGECEFMTGDLDGADLRLTALATKTTTRAERAALTWLRVTLYTAMDKSPRAVEIGLFYLNELGISWTPEPSAEVVQSEYDALLRQIGDRQIEDLVNLPLMEDTERRAALDVLMAVLPPAIYTNKNLVLLVLCRAANISVEHGNTDASTVGYAYLGMYLGPSFDDWMAGYGFARLGLDLLEKRGLGRYKARVFMTLGYHVMPWTKSIDDGTYTLLSRTFEAANEAGDVNYVAYYWYCLVATHLVRGTDLAQVQRDAEAGLAFVRRTNFGLLIAIISAQLALVRGLQGAAIDFGRLNSGDFNEVEFEALLAENKSLEIAEVMYLTRKLAARVIAGDFPAALSIVGRVESRARMTDGHLEIAEFYFYAALARAASLTGLHAGAQRAQRDAIVACHQQLHVWAGFCASNWKARESIVAAEIARIEGRDLDAMRLYEEAIKSAIAHGYVNNEAIALECAARFYAARGFETTSQAYLRNARDAYARWGAVGKVRQLDGLLPAGASLPSEGPPQLPFAQLHELRELDVASVLKSSQAVSAETDLARLMETLMEIVLQHAGAQRGVLAIPRGDSFRIAALAQTSTDRISVKMDDAPLTPTAMPESILRYVLRTRESVLLHDASLPNAYAADPYIAQNRCRSVLCMPLLKQAELIGVLYLENGLTSHAFTPKRMAMLEVLASQAAISLQNAGLYAELQRENGERRQSEAALRRSEERFALAVEAAGDGHTDWIAATGEFYASSRLLDMCGLPADSVFAGEGDWFARLPLHPDDRERVFQVVSAHFESEATRLEVDMRIIRSGETRWMHATLLCTRDREGRVIRVNTAITDVTERMQAELGRRTAQSELARVTRLTTVGQLAISIAHEINQPLAAIVTNAGAGANFLKRAQPDVTEARQTFAQILQDSRRAADVIQGLMSLSRRSEPKLTRVDMNSAVREVFVLLQSEFDRNATTLQAQLDPAEPIVLADRVQVQQVLINLAMNAMEAMVESSARVRTVTFATHRTDAGVLVSVRDTGPGIGAEARDRIFEPFFTTKAKGTGIGLSICRSIIESHGSQLSVVTDPSCGALFQFELGRAD